MLNFMVAHACNPSIQEAGIGGSPVQGQPGLYSETLFHTHIHTHTHTHTHMDAKFYIVSILPQ
jgi:hypothetical protein